MKRTVLMFGIVVLTSLAAQAQLKIPKIFKPKEQPKQTTPPTTIIRSLSLADRRSHNLRSASLPACEQVPG